MPSVYRLYIDSEKTEHRVKGTSPAKALKQLVEAADETLLSQKGRYGTTQADQYVMALTEPYGRVQYDDARTTRLL